MIKVKEDLKGKKFGRLTVLCQAEDFVGLDGKRRSQWLCECNCDNKNQVIVQGSCLKNKKTQSCGCIRKEKIIIKNKSNKNGYFRKHPKGACGSFTTKNDNPTRIGG